MKKIGLFISLTLFMLLVTACVNTTDNPTTPATTTTTTGTPATTLSPDEVTINSVYDWVNPGTLTNLTNASDRLIFATSRDGVNISWEISHPAVIAANGVITQPTHESGNVTVTLTATLTLNDLTRTKEFSAMVLAESSPEDAEAIINETFSGYADGNIISQSGGLWAPVSGKTGTSRFYVVSSIPGTTIPEGSKALQVNAFTELQVEAGLVHSLDLVVIEADVYQTANGSPIYLQTSKSSPVVGFGVYGGGSDTARLFYRTDNGEQYQTNVALNTWHKIRLEVDLVQKTMEFFYYDADGHLVSCTPGPVTYVGTLSLNQLFIRSGSSTAVSLNEHPSYVTNLIANRIEALPRPEDPVKLGTVSGIESTVSVSYGETFTPSVPIVASFFGTPSPLTEDVDYSVTVNNPVNTLVEGDYTVTYTITNLSNPLDTITKNQTVTVFNPLQPNIISGATSTIGGAVSHKTSVTVAVVRPEGTLHYVNSATPLTAAEILASEAKKSIAITETTVILEDLVVPPEQKIYFVIELNGNSNVLEHTVTYQTLVTITTPEEFYTAVHLTQNNQTDKYFILGNNIDFTGYTWVPVANTFYATLDGNGYSISNLSINKVGMKGGIISKLDGGIIRRLVVDHVTAFSDGSGSGLLVGELYGVTLIENIEIKNSSNVVQIDLSTLTDTSKAASYGAMIAGRIRSGSTTIRNITILDSSVESKHNYGGGLVAGMEIGTSAVFQDIYLANFVVKEATDTVTVTGQMVGGIIGRVQGNVTIERVVAINVDVIGLKNVGGFIGKSDEVGAVVVVKDAYINGTISFTSGVSEHNNILAGNMADQAVTAENAWASNFPNVGTMGLGVIEGNLIDASVTQVETWWTANIPAILNSSLWDFGTAHPVLVHPNE